VTTGEHLLRVNLRKGKRFAPFFFVAAKAATHNARPNFLCALAA
jgi:hypothetical protein